MRAKIHMCKIYFCYFDEKNTIEKSKLNTFYSFPFFVLVAQYYLRIKHSFTVRINCLTPNFKFVSMLLFKAFFVKFICFILFMFIF